MGRTCRNDFELLKISDGVWMKLPPTTNSLCGLGHVLGIPIAVGGRRGSGRRKKPLCNVEIFDSNSGQWLPLPSIGVPRERPSVCVTEKGMIIVVGGCSKRVLHAAIEALDLSALIGRL